MDYIQKSRDKNGDFLKPVQLRISLDVDSVRSNADMSSATRRSWFPRFSFRFGFESTFELWSLVGQLRDKGILSFREKDLCSRLCSGVLKLG